MKNKALKCAALLGTATVASFILAACGSNSSSNKSSESGDKNVTVYVEEQYKAYIEKAAAAFEKETGSKVTKEKQVQYLGDDCIDLIPKDKKIGRAHV